LCSEHKCVEQAKLGQIVNSEYWELDGLSKRYPMMILPLAGALITLASFVNLVEDGIAIRRKTYRLRFLDKTAASESDS